MLLPDKRIACNGKEGLEVSVVKGPEMNQRAPQGRLVLKGHGVYESRERVNQGEPPNDPA